MEKDLSELRKIAELEESHQWGRWAVEKVDLGGYSVFINDEGLGRSYVATDIEQGESGGKSTAEFIATFDPSTVLELISQIEYYERKMETLADLGRASHEWNVNNRTELKERLEKAEQAVARVEKALAENTFEEDRWSAEVVFSWVIREALDGDTLRCLECNGTGVVQVRFNHGIQAQDCAVCFGTGGTRG